MADVKGPQVIVFLYVLLGVAIGYVLGRVRIHSFQNRGEAIVSRAIRARFDSPDFHLLNHVTLKLKNGTTQVDHILVSRFGVFVIETKHFSGWIFANTNHPTWTQVIYARKFRFPNPIMQNSRHVRAVEALLDFLPANSVKSLVVFTGEAEFKTDMPAGVFTISGLVQHLQESTAEVMSLNRVQFCVGRLETHRLAVSRETDLQHLQSLQRRHGGLI